MQFQDTSTEQASVATVYTATSMGPIRNSRRQKARSLSDSDTEDGMSSSRVLLVIWGARRIVVRRQTNYAVRPSPFAIQLFLAANLTGQRTQLLQSRIQT